MEEVEDLAKFVLPNIDRIPGLIKDFNGDVILKPISFDKRNVPKMFLKQRIYISVDNCDDVFLLFERCIQERPAAYICKVDQNFEYYVTFVGHNQTLYVLDSGILNGKISLNNQIPDTLHRRLQQYRIEWVRCPQATFNNSLCHAYTNAKVMLWSFSSVYTQSDYHIPLLFLFVFVTVCVLKIEMSSLLMASLVVLTYFVISFFSSHPLLSYLQRYVDNHKFDLFLKTFDEIPLVTTSNVNKMFASMIGFNDDSDDSTDDEIKCQSRQRQIDEFIKKSVQQNKHISAIKREIKREHFALDTREELYIEQTYIDRFEELFLTEVSVYFQNSPQDKVLNEVTQFLTKFAYATIDDLLKNFKSTFNTMQTYPLFDNCLKLRSMTNTRSRKFVEKFKKLCTEIASHSIQFFEEEQRFALLFDEYLLNCFKNNKTPFDEEFNMKCWIDGKICIKSIVVYLETNANDELCMLRTQSREIKTWSHILQNTLSSALTKFKEDVHINLKDGIIICKGSYIRLDKIFQDILIQFSAFHELQIFASNVVIVNTNIFQPGKNLVIVSPTIFVKDGKYIWDLSGQNGMSNLANSEDRAKHAIGIDRDREKLVQITKTLNPDAKLESYIRPVWIESDPYSLKISEKIKSCQTIDELWDIARIPSPYD